MSPEFMLEGCGRFPGPMSGVGGLGTVISNGSWLMVTWDPSWEQTDICENITFPQPRLWAVMIVIFYPVKGMDS